MSDEEKPKKRRGVGGMMVSEPRDLSGEVRLGMPTPKGKPLSDPNKDSKKAVEDARKQK